MIAAIALATSLALPAAAHPTLHVLEAKRTASAAAFGFHYDYDDGVFVTDTSVALSDEWVADLDADLIDWSGHDVARGLSYQESHIGPASLSFTLDVGATAAGNHLMEDSSGEGEYRVRFRVNEKVRFVVRAHVDVSHGYNGASVALDGNSGAVFTLDADSAESEDLEQAGWIDAGVYLITGDAEVFAYGTTGVADVQFGNAECEFHILHAADFDTDGDVDTTDRSGFLRAYLAGDAAADFDLDGDTDSADWDAFRKAWQQAMN